MASIESPLLRWLERKSVGPHKFSSTQFNLPSDLAAAILELAAEIPDADLAADGRESEPHVTIKYGLHTSNPQDVMRLVRDFGPVTITLGAVSLFAANEGSIQRGGAAYDVVKIDVTGDRLHELNRLLSGSLPHSDSHPIYRPHVTLAYAQPGLGQKYSGRRDLAGRSVTFHELVFSDQEGRRVKVPLGRARSALLLSAPTLKRLMKSAAFDENKHPRAADGRFGAVAGAHDATTEKPDAGRADNGKPISANKPARGAQDKPAKAPAPEHHPGAAHGSAVKIKPVKQRAWQGEPVPLKTPLTKQETGRVGEAVVLAYLRDVLGRKDARPMNTGKTNFPIDMIEDHAPTEVKAGLASNSRKAQQWRLTFSQESKAEKAWYEKATPAERTTWNAQKQQRIHERKKQVIAELENRTGKKIKPRTITVVVNPDTHTADLFVFQGLHDRIDWRSPQAQAGYKMTVKYDHA